jgi:hypothetical protein
MSPTPAATLARLRVEWPAWSIGQYNTSVTQRQFYAVRKADGLRVTAPSPALLEVRLLDPAWAETRPEVVICGPSGWLSGSMPDEETPD